jgi:NAD(P)H dehydrogenase (quinone)
MVRPKILVTGATGKTGAAVVAKLREQEWPVRAVVRTRDVRSARLEQLGAEIAIADLYDPQQLLEAMRSTQRAYYLTPFEPFMIHSAVAFALAAREARLDAVVTLSQWLASANHPSLMTRQSWLAEGLMSMIPDIAHIVLNPGYFADNYLRLIDFAALLGVLPNLTGDSRNAPPSNEDIARVAAAVLMDPGKHAGKTYRPTGPELLSVRDMAVILGRVLGRKVRPLPMPFWMFAKAARLQGVDSFDLSNIRYYTEDHKHGAFEFNAPTNDVLDVTGSPAESFETTARRYAALPKAQRSFTNVLRASFDFMRTPMLPGYDLGGYERLHRHPRPPTPKFAMADTEWKRMHGGESAADFGARHWNTPSVEHETVAPDGRSVAMTDRLTND